MPYCRKCGAKLVDDAQYCFNCGTPVVSPTVQTPPPPEPSRIPKSQPLRKNPLFIPVMIIIAITVFALVIAVVAAMPLNPVNYSDQNRIGQSGLNKLNLDFDADVGEIHVYTNLTDGMALMDVSATGGTSIFASNQPVTFTVQNSTSNTTQMVTAKVSTPNSFPFAGNLHVVCNIYVNPQVDLTLNVRSTVGEVTMEADSNAKISSLKLEATTGNVNLKLQKGVVVNGGLTVSTSIGNVLFSMNQVGVNGNVTFDLSSGTGNVEMDITQTQKFNGNLQVDGHTGTGNVNLIKMLIDGEVAARIRSNTGLGEVNVDVQNFNGNQSPIQSNNYPSACNINMNLNTGIGTINLKAVYQTNIAPTLRF
ncbi:MAG: zinc-ribbon domain-containing protein [Candidatus Bathyarchaeia archaeon]|jgi:hypothetical protein